MAPVTLPPAGMAITDGGLETTLIFHYGLELPDFAAFVLLDSDAGIAALRRYYAPYVDIARERGIPVLLDTPTWRANPDWGARLGYDRESLVDVNRRAVALLRETETESAAEVLVSGAIGPRGDGYVVEATMSAEEAEEYHALQVRTFADAGADLVSAITLTYADEAVGIARVAARVAIPAVLAFTVGTDGRLPSGQPLGEAIEEVDGRTGGAVAYFMVNCAHPTHFAHVLDGAWTARVRGVRANASTMSHEELDAADELDDGDPEALAADYVALRARLPNVTVVGGCCGTDHRHVAAVAAAFAG